MFAAERLCPCKPATANSYPNQPAPPGFNFPLKKTEQQRNECHEDQHYLGGGINGCLWVCGERAGPQVEYADEYLQEWLLRRRDRGDRHITQPALHVRATARLAELHPPQSQMPGRQAGGRQLYSMHRPFGVGAGLQEAFDRKVQVRIMGELRLG